MGGDLDPSFGGNGIVTTPIGSSDDFGTDLAIDSQGRIVLGGASRQGPSTGSFVLARYNPDGSLDGSFGTGGTVTTPIGSDDSASAVAIDSQGRIILAGSSHNGASSYDFALARYNPDGSLDGSFGTGGKAVIVESGQQGASDMAIDAQGRIVLVGPGLLVRLSPEGSLDGSFGTGGKVVEGEDGGASAVVIDAQGRIVTVNPQNTSIGWPGWLARYNPDGRLDGSFGSGGKVDIEFGSDVEIDSQGRIVTSGHPYSADSGSDLAGLARYNPDGSLDGSFGSGGSVANIYRGTAGSLVLDAQGRMVFAGTAIQDEFAVGRLMPDGELDTSFSTDGTVFTAVGSEGAGASDVAIDSEGRIVLGGSSSKPAVRHFGSRSQGIDRDFALARYIADAPARHARTLNLSYSAKADKFKGKLASKEPACIAKQKIRVFEKEKGTDPKMGTTKASNKGKYSLKEKNADGKFYASVKEASTSAGTCLAAKSKTVKVG